jgi:hypothetical protein
VTKKLIRPLFRNVVAILRGGEEGHTLFIILPVQVQSNSLSLLRHTDHLTSQTERVVKQVTSSEQQKYTV